MNRRHLLKTLTSATAIGAMARMPTAEAAPDIPAVTRHAPTTFDASPTSTLDAFNNQFRGYNYAERVGQFSIFFTGFKQGYTQSGIHGQWLAWPGNWLPDAERRAMNQYYVATVPTGEVGAYKKGASFTLHPHGIAWDEFCTQAGWDRVIAEVEAGRERLLRLLREAA